VIVHSYIGQQPVYSEVLHCHIYPTPDYKPPKREKAKTYKGEFKRGPRQKYVTQCALIRDRISAWLRENGPATGRILAERLDISNGSIENSLRYGVNVVFFRLGRADDGHNSWIYGISGQSLADMKTNCDVARFREDVAEALQRLGEARRDEIANVLGVDVKRVGNCLSMNKHLFVYKRLGSTEYVWRLKEAA